MGVLLLLPCALLLGACKSNGDAKDPGGDGDGGGGSGNDSACNDGIDNDGDGLTDWQMDTGCYGPTDSSEKSEDRSKQNGFTTWDFGPDSRLIYVSNSGDDSNDGLTPQTALKSITHAAELVRDGSHDFIRLRRGDTWRDERLGKFKSGQDAAHPLVIGSYGDSKELPRIEVAAPFIDMGGKSLNFVAFVDLHFFQYLKDPNDPAFSGEGSSILRMIGSGGDFLVEGCHLEYGELVFQSYEGEIKNVEVRATVVEKAYHANTCKEGNPSGDSTHRPSGMYSSHLKGLTVENSFFDHNGWNEDVPSACATIYNHNVYLGADELLIRNNVFTRASSMHIKLRSDETGGMTDIEVDNNYFVEGEIAVSIGGNTSEPDRFAQSKLTNNVLSDIGRSRPTGRTLAWGFEILDNNELLVSENLILNQDEPGVGNSYGMHIERSQKKLTIEKNILYNLQGQGIWTEASSSQSGMVITSNLLASPEIESSLMNHAGSFDAYSYSKNSYLGMGESWFKVDGSSANYETWLSASGETGAQMLESLDFPDPSRNIESYAKHLGLGDSLQDFIDAARKQTRLNWDPKLEAEAINDYIRAGFGR